LTAWTDELRRLLDETPSDETSQKYQKRIYHATDSVGNVTTRKGNSGSRGLMVDRRGRDRNFKFKTWDRQQVPSARV